MSTAAATVKLPARYRSGAIDVRATLAGAAAALFDLLCVAGRIGVAFPYRRANAQQLAGAHDPRRVLRRRISRDRRSIGSRSAAEWSAASQRLTDHLHRALSQHPNDPSYHALRQLLGNASIALAPDCQVPEHPILRAAWEVLVDLFPRLYGSQVKAFDRLPWLDDSLLRALRREATTGVAVERGASGRRPGPRGRELAVDPRLMRTLSKALGRKVVPGFEARYLYYTKPGDYFFPHPDDPEYAVNVLVCLERRLPSASRTGSAFVAYRPGATVERFEIAPGGAVAAEARGVMHGREALQSGERTILLSIAVNYARPRAIA